MDITRRHFLTASAALLAQARLRAQQQPLETSAPGVKIYARPRDYADDLPQYLTRLVAEARAERLKILAGIATRDQALERQKYIRAKLWELLGGRLEERDFAAVRFETVSFSPGLKPRIVGSIEREGYRIDRLIYESRPGLYVTANLYVPAGRGPFPAVLSPLGHSANGKAYALYQTLFHSLARKGYVVLAYDPFGQGERIEYPGPEPGTSRLGGATREHSYAGRRLLLLGVNFALYRAWDGIRGIDYLLTRDDVDPKRIGCGGQSGGGTLTMFLVALDERIQAAVVSEGNTENMAQEYFEPPGPVADAEQNIVPSLPAGLDRFDLLHAFAPKSLLICIGNKDAGTTYSPEHVRDGLAGFEELRATWRLFGAEERLKLVETPMRHGYNYEHRRASYAWYNRWLGRSGQATPGGVAPNDSEPPVRVEPDNKLWCTDTGFVVTSLKGETSFTLTRKLAQKIIHTEPPAVEDIWRVLGLAGDDTPADPRNRAGIDRAASVSERSSNLASQTPQLKWPGAPPMELLSVTEKYDHVIEEVDLVSEREIHVPAWVVHPPDPKSEPPQRPAVLWLADAGKDPAVAEGGIAAEFSRASFVFCAAEVRGRGQCTPRPPSRGPRYYGGRDEDGYVWDTLVLGRPMLGGYVRDAFLTLHYLRARPDVDAARVWVIGQGSMGVVALFALALYTGVRGGIVQSALTDYRSVVENDHYTAPFRMFLPSVLKHFDLPELAKLIAPRPLLLLNPVDQAGNRVAEHQARLRYPSATVRTVSPVSAATYLDWLRQT